MNGENIHAPHDLKCEYTTNPIGVDIKKPIFSWKLKHRENNQKQTAYRIIVSSSLENIEKEIGDMWDSGKINSDEQIVRYNGKTLEPCKTYYWKVKWWDSNGKESPFSEYAVFETGLQDKKNWKAKWISKREYLYEEYIPQTFTLHSKFIVPYSPIFRKKFNADKKIKKARAYICGLGFYELYINGKKIGDRVLDPGQTDYDKRVLYTVYDVTPDIVIGENVIVILLGNGRYVKEYGYDFPKLIFQLTLTYEDNTEKTVISDESWKVSYSPITFNNLYHGEIYDARKEINGIHLPKFIDDAWENAIEVEGPKGKLISEVYPPIRTTKIIKPIKIWDLNSETYVVDFGQNFSGWIRIKVRTNEKGRAIRIRYAELINEDGSINTSTNRAARATDIYITKGHGMEIYEPRFTYHGFRYVEIIGFPGVLTPDDIEGIVVHSDVEKTGEFLCSNELFNKIHQNILWTQLSNLMSIPTDSPQRDERMGWLGDAHLSAEEAIYNFDMISFYRKFLRDIKDSQREDGCIPDLVPPYWKIYPGDPAWTSAYISITWYLYIYYGDKYILEEHYDNLKKYIDYLRTLSSNNIITYYKYGDWCQPGSVSAKDNSGKLISTFYLYHDIYLFCNIAKILNKDEDYKFYSELLEKITEAFNNNFLHDNFYSTFSKDFIKEFIEKELKNYPQEIRDTVSGHLNIMSNLGMFTSQTLNVLPLYLNLVPEKAKEKVLQTLIHDIANIHDYHLNTGVIGTRYILEVLSNNGFFDVAYKIMNQKSYPSLGYMIEEGATTLWERWEKLTSNSMNSHNHIMFGSVDTWFYKYLAGIKLIEPGWKKFLIEPHMTDDLKWAKASLKTIRGEIFICWRRLTDGYIIQLNIPVNSEAEIRIPILSKEDKITIKSKENIKITPSILNAKYVFNLGSGFYTISVGKT